MSATIALASDRCPPDLKELAESWFAIDDEIRELTENVADLRVEKKELEDKLIEKMYQNDVAILESDRGNIKASTSLKKETRRRRSKQTQAAQS